MDEAAPRRGGRTFNVREMVGYAVIIGAVWLGWEIVKVPVVQRAMPAFAARLSPQSPEVLRRLAESELAADRPESARELAGESLVRSPFSAAALRVRGLAEARLGDPAGADQILTLAGNWSLRDDPAHTWLMDHRLRRGNYGSAFAHADTLARRRLDLQPRLFELFTVAATVDQRSFPHLARRLAINPPWRGAYFDYLLGRPDGAPVIGGLAVALDKTAHPLTNAELQKLYSRWAGQNRLAGMKALREQLGRPPLSEYLQNGDFSVDPSTQPFPFGWQLGGGAGLGASLTPDDLNPRNTAMRVDYDGFGSGVFAEQLLMLPSGQYELTGSERLELPLPEPAMVWRITCVESGAVIGEHAPPPSDEERGWTKFSTSFAVPAQNCSAQWLSLNSIAKDTRSAIAVWFDSLRISASS